MKALSKKRKQVLDAITGFMDRHKYPPSVRDVVQICSMSSTSVADYHLKALEREGYIRRESGVSRGIEVIGYDGRDADIFRAPLLGYHRRRRASPRSHLRTLGFPWKPSKFPRTWLAAGRMSTPSKSRALQ